MFRSAVFKCKRTAIAAQLLKWKSQDQDQPTTTRFRPFLFWFVMVFRDSAWPSIRIDPREWNHKELRPRWGRHFCARDSCLILRTASFEVGIGHHFWHFSAVNQVPCCRKLDVLLCLIRNKGTAWQIDTCRLYRKSYSMLLKLYAGDPSQYALMSTVRRPWTKQELEHLTKNYVWDWHFLSIGG